MDKVWLLRLAGVFYKMFEFLFILTGLYMLWVGWTALQSAEKDKAWSSKNSRRKLKEGDCLKKVNITEEGNGDFDARSESGYAASDHERHQEVDEDIFDDSWFVVLQVGEDASIDEITRSYKKLISQYHPDKVATLGYELRVLAESKSKQINSAYESALSIKRMV